MKSSLSEAGNGFPEHYKNLKAKGLWFTTVALKDNQYLIPIIDSTNLNQIIMRENIFETIDSFSIHAKKPALQWHNEQKESDPSYLIWVFDNADNIGDYGIGMTGKQIEDLKNLELRLSNLLKSLKIK